MLSGPGFKYLFTFIYKTLIKYLPQVRHSPEHFIYVNSVNPRHKPRHSYHPHCKGELSHRRVRKVAQVIKLVSSETWTFTQAGSCLNCCTLLPHGRQVALETCGAILRVRWG